MASLESVLIKQARAFGTTLQAGTDQPVVIRLRKVGAETATSVTVTTATNIVLVGSTTTDTIAFATYTTYGTVVDAINATGRWEAKLLDGLRSKSSASTLLDGAITAGTDANGVIVWDVLSDTSTALQIAVCLSVNRDFDITKKSHRVHLQQVVYAVNMGTAAVDSFQIFLRRGTVETKIFSQLSVDTTETTLTFASGYGKISGQLEDDEIIVLIKDAATLSDSTSNFVRVVGVIE